MIDSISEQLLSLANAANLLPARRRGRKPHVSTLYRWATAGCRGVVLETIRIGGTRCTTPEALQRFFESLSTTTNSSANNPLNTLPRTTTRRMRDSEAAARSLERSGA
jgi:hypothetical protein